MALANPESATHLVFTYFQDGVPITGCIMPETVDEGGSHYWSAHELAERVSRLPKGSILAITNIEVANQTEAEVSPGEQEFTRQICNGRYQFNLSLDELTVPGDDTVIKLTALEAGLLSTLSGSPGLCFTRGELLQIVWRHPTGWVGGSRTVDVHLARLREKLGTDAARHITAIRGKGYAYLDKVR